MTHATATDAETAAEAAPPMARTDPRHRRERRAYKIRGPETWALIRESYLAGASARELARRYDVTEWAIWRRAWRQGWTKQDRVEPTPPPALMPLMPGAGAETADAAALAREALKGVGRALAESRLDEARRLAQLATSLGRLAGGAGGGDYSLNDMVRVVFDAEFRTEVMRIDPDGAPSPDKSLYWTLARETEDANGLSLAELKTEGFYEGRAELRAELGLGAEGERREVYWFYAGRVYRRGEGDGRTPNR